MPHIYGHPRIAASVAAVVIVVGLFVAGLNSEYYLRFVGFLITLGGIMILSALFREWREVRADKKSKPKE